MAKILVDWSQCTCRCVVLPDTYGVVMFWRFGIGLNAPTGAWRSLTRLQRELGAIVLSQCTYRCVVLPDKIIESIILVSCSVSMHLQVRGAP